MATHSTAHHTAQDVEGQGKSLLAFVPQGAATAAPAVSPTAPIIGPLPVPLMPTPEVYVLMLHGNLLCALVHRDTSDGQPSMNLGDHHKIVTLPWYSAASFNDRLVTLLCTEFGMALDDAKKVADKVKLPAPQKPKEAA